jgi:hypothetical protein
MCVVYRDSQLWTLGLELLWRPHFFSQSIFLPDKSTLHSNSRITQLIGGNAVSVLTSISILLLSITF